MQYKLNNDDAAYIEKVFPEIDWIKDEDLKSKVIEIWAEVWRESKWDKIEDCPKNPLKDGDLKLVPHIRSVTALCVDFAKALPKYHTQAEEPNMDDLVAGAILHDVDKLLIYEKKPDGTFGKSKFSKMLPHGTYTGYKMMERGFSMDMVNLVVAHSENATYSVPQTLEGLIMKSADHAESEVMHFYGPKPAKGGK